MTLVSKETYSKIIPQMIQGAEKTAPSTKEEAAKKESPENDIFKLLEKLDGLPSDMQVVASQIQKLYSEQDQLTPEQLTSAYLQSLTSIQTAKFNKDEYTRAYNEVTKNGGANEVAITEQGQLVISGAGGTIQTISPEAYAQNPGKYHALTNHELLQLRAQDPDFFNHNQVLKIVENGIGQQKVTELIQRCLTGMGSDQNKEAWQGMQMLMQQNAELQAAGQESGSLNAIFKNGTMNKTQQMQAQRAMSWLWYTLPENARTWLKVKSNGTDKGAQALLETLVFSKVDESDALSSLAGGKGANGNSAKQAYEKMKVGWWTVYTDGAPSLKETTVLQLSEGSSAIKLDVTRGKIQGKDNTNLSVCTFNDLKEKTAVTGLVDEGQMYFGDVALNTMLGGDDMLVDPNRAYKVDLPLDEDALAQGIKKPRSAEQMLALDDVQAKIRAQKLDPSKPEDIEKINELYVQAHFPPKYIKQGNTWVVNKDKWFTFMAIDAYVTDRAIELDSLGGKQEPSKHLVKKVTDAEEKTIVAQLEASLHRSGKLAGDSKYDYDYDSWWIADWFDNHNSIYKGIVYLPVTGNATSVAMYMGDGYVTYNNYWALEGDSQTVRAKQDAATGARPESKRQFTIYESGNTSY